MRRERYAYVNAESINFVDKDNRFLYGYMAQHPEYAQAYAAVTTGDDWLLVKRGVRFIGDSPHDYYMNLADEGGAA